MIVNWSIENFKSFKNRTDLTFAPITIFAGANSSGKSSIIQSLLIIKQTVEYAPRNRHIALNGPLVKLGQFSDVRNNLSRVAHVALGWTLQPTRAQVASAAASSDLSLGLYVPVKQVSYEVHFDTDRDSLATSYPDGSRVDLLRELQPTVSQVALRSVAPLAVDVDDEYPEPNDHVGEIVAKRPAQNQANEAGPDKDEKAFADTAPVLYDMIRIDPESLNEVEESRSEARIVGVELRNFHPDRLRVSYNAGREKARRISETLVKMPSLSSRVAREFSEYRIPVSVYELMQRVLSAEGYSLQGSLFSSGREGRPTLAEFLSALRDIWPTGPRRVGSVRRPWRVLEEHQPQLEALLQQEIGNEEAFTKHDIDQNDSAIAYTQRFFSSAVRYLGPLRDDPKPIYPLEALAAPTQVGYRGEHTAAVLDLNRDRQVEYIPSSVFEGELSNVPAFTSRASLHDAVVDWLIYLGVAHDVATTDRGKLGHQLQVSTDGETQFHDLTNVGVGVSQVLPIIVMALLAPSGSALIFEQPELHLHPKVQARLADFFLAMALQGKQCILETHSEYLIERMRKRIAESQEENFNRLLRIYFVERTQGESICKPIEVSRYGAVANWPADFFDQSQKETEGILVAARRKRNFERKTKQ